MQVIELDERLSVIEDIAKLPHLQNIYLKLFLVIQTRLCIDRGRHFQQKIAEHYERSDKGQWVWDKKEE